jgi:D-lactate dehydrogenase
MVQAGWINCLQGRTSTSIKGGGLDVFFYEAFAEEAGYLQQYLPPGIAAGFTRKTIQEYDAVEPPTGLISIRTQSVIPASWATKLAGILTRSTGYDHILAFLRQCGIDLPCGHLLPYCSRAVAEQAMLLWTALLRNLPGQSESFASFNRDGLTGWECEGKTLLVVGVGNIGYEVIKIGQVLGMQVLGVDIVENYPSVKYVSIDQGLGVADIIVCAMNLTAGNRHYFNYHLLKQVRRGAVFVNISRGEQSPSADLLRLLDENHLGGVGLDVFNHESELADSLRDGRSSDDAEVANTLELAGRTNVICTPHNAFNTHEAIARKSKLSIEQIAHFLKNGEFIRPVPRKTT